MKTTLLIGGLTLGLVAWSAEPAWAQRGVGNSSGVARQAVKPDVVHLGGRVKEIRTGPCESTTGRAPVGTHILLTTSKKKTLNVHLGPAAAVADAVSGVKVGDQIEVEAFRTDELEKADFIAQTLILGDERITLRDDQLRPTWAGGGGAMRTARFGPGACGWGMGPGRGAGRGPGQGWGGPGRGPRWR